MSILNTTRFGSQKLGIYSACLKTLHKEAGNRSQAVFEVQPFAIMDRKLDGIPIRPTRGAAA